MRPESSLIRALREGTGAGVKVGILDTGVIDLPHLEGSIGGHFRVVDDGTRIEVVECGNGEDRLNHGTACAGILHRHAPGATLFDLAVMDYKAPNSRHKLAAAIRFATRQGWDVLNICVGTQSDFDRLREITEEAVDAGLILLSAIDSDAPFPGFPAAYPGVVSVDHDFFDDPLSFEPGRRADLCGHGIYVEAPNARGEPESFTGSSFACPHLTALAARVRQFHPEMTSPDWLEAMRTITVTV